MRWRTGLWLVTLVAGAATVAYVARSPEHADRDRGAAVPGAAERLVPLDMAEVAAVEIVDGGALHRFERDAAGRWLYHRHAPAAQAAGAHRHQADPEAAARIEEAFAMLGRATVERVVGFGVRAADYGLVRPQVIVMLYRDPAARPVLRLLAGDHAPGSLTRYVLTAETQTVVTVPDSHIAKLRELVAASAPAPEEEP